MSSTAKPALTADARQLLALARELDDLRHRLDRIARHLPSPPAAMVEGQQAPDLATFLLGTLEHISHDDLGPAVRKLHQAASARPDRLHAAWQQSQEGPARGQVPTTNGQPPASACTLDSTLSAPGSATKPPARHRQHQPRPNRPAAAAQPSPCHGPTAVSMLHHVGVGSLQRQHRGMATWFPERYEQLRIRLIAARNRAGLSQAQVANSLGVPQQHISRVETGDRRLDPIELQAFAQLYGVPVSDFLDP